MWLSRKSIVVTGNNSKYFVLEYLCHFQTPGSLKGTGQQGQISLLSFPTLCTTGSSSLSLKTLFQMTWDLDSGLDGQQSNKAISFHLSISQTKGRDEFICPIFYLLHPFLLRFGNSCHVLQCLSSTNFKVLCRDYVLLSPAQKGMSKELNFCKCCTATEHKNQ